MEYPFYHKTPEMMVGRLFAYLELGTTLPRSGREKLYVNQSSLNLTSL